MTKFFLSFAILFLSFYIRSSNGQCVATKPTGLFADNVSACGVTLHWDSIPNIAFYRLNYKQTGSATWLKVPANIVAHEYVFSGLQANTLYNFKVTSYCSASQKSKAAKLNQQTGGCTQADPGPVVLDTAGNIHLTWNAGCSLYSSNRLRYRDKDSYSWIYVNTGTSTIATLSALTNDVTYLFQVQSCSDTAIWSLIDSFNISSKPNIVVILVDDARFDSYSCNGAPSWFQSPGIDRIANEGVNFKNNYAVYSECAPSRATFYTGLYPHSNGAYNNKHNYFPDLPTTGSILHSNGYYTSMTGKFLKEQLDNTPQPGWDFWMAKTSGGQMRVTYNHNGVIVNITAPELDILSDTFLAVYKKHINRSPIFSVIAFNSPHEPYNPLPADSGVYASEEMPFPQDFYAAQPPVPNFYQVLSQSYNDSSVCRHDWEGYFETMRGVDRTVNKMLDSIKKYAPLNSSLIVYTSDNGHLIGEHELNGKVFPYQESIRVPLFMRYPKWFPSGTVNSTIPALNVDLAPTILDAAGIENTYNMQGCSLHDLFIGNKNRSSFYYEAMQVASPQTPDFRSVISNLFSYTRYFCDSEVEQFFDLSIDPLETTNLVYDSNYQSEIETYRNRLDSFSIALNDTNPYNKAHCYEVLQNFQRLKNTSAGFLISPNPASDLLQVSFSGLFTEAEVINENGVEVQHLNISSAVSGFQIQVKNLPEGIYLIRIKGESGFFTKKISVLH